MVDNDILAVDVVQAVAANVNDDTGTNINARHFAEAKLTFCDIHVYLDWIDQVVHGLRDLTLNNVVAVMQLFRDYESV